LRGEDLKSNRIAKVNSLCSRCEKINSLDNGIAVTLTRFES
jgi:hypothetical protein